MSLSRQVSLALALAGGLWSGPGCGAAPEVGTPAALVDGTERALRALGADRYDLVSWKPREGRIINYVDDYGAHSRFRSLDFEARIRFVVARRTEGPPSVNVRVREPGWNIEDEVRVFEQVVIEGGGIHAAGDERTLEAAAMFDEPEAGAFRFRNFDRRRPR